LQPFKDRKVKHQLSYGIDTGIKAKQHSTHDRMINTKSTWISHFIENQLVKNFKDGHKQSLGD